MTTQRWALLALPALLFACHDDATPSVAHQVAQAAAGAVVPSAWADNGQALLTRDPNRIADVAEATVPSVVFIASSRRVARGGAQRFPFVPGMPEGLLQRGSGSGVIVDQDGLILTNNHVVAGADELEVTLYDGRKFAAKVRGTDPATDLALVELVEPPADLPAVVLGDSDALRLGEVVLAIGSPFELQGTVTMGIVSARGRAGMGLAAYEDYIQTDAAINPGNSGGALVDLQGRLVGINTAIRSQSGGYDGIGFAIPSNLAEQILGQLRADGKVVRGYLGVGIEDVDPRAATTLGLKDPRGAVVTRVAPDTAAAKAGVEVYDVIVAVDGVPIDDTNDLRHTIALKGVDAKVQLDVMRDGRSKRLAARLGSLDQDPSEEAPQSEPEELQGLLEGLSMQTLDNITAERLGVDELGGGVLVTSVAPGSPAAAAGLHPGDVIIEVNQGPTPDLETLRKRVRRVDQAMLLVQRGPQRRIVILG